MFIAFSSDVLLRQDSLLVIRTEFSDTIENLETLLKARSR